MEANKQSSATRQRFTREEDNRILSLYRELGPNQWDTIANILGNRTPRQCRERWLYHIDPDLNNSPWTPEEDDLLLRLYSENGPKWTALAKFFRGRANCALKNRFCVLTYQAKTSRATSSSNYSSSETMSSGSEESTHTGERFATIQTARTIRYDKMSNNDVNYFQDKYGPLIPQKPKYVDVSIKALLV